MRIRYVNRLTRADVGQRVVIRRWVRDERGGMVQSDVVGTLESWSDAGLLVVRTKRDEPVVVNERDILAAKTVPPPREKRGRDIGR